MATRKRTHTVRKQNPVSLVNQTPKVFSPLRFVKFLLIIVLAGILVFSVAKRYRHLFVVGIVNTTPITRWQLDKVVFTRYGKTTLDELVNTVLLEQLAKKNQVKITKADIDGEIANLEERLGGKEALKTNMERFGIDEAKLKQEVEAILVQKKLAQKLFQITVSDEEIKKYYTDNKTLFTNKTLVEVEGDIRQSLEQEKTQQQFTTWFQDERQKAKINLFI